MFNGSSAIVAGFLYPLPPSTITLDIVYKKSSPLPESAISACLSGAIAESEKQAPQSSLVEVFRYSPPTGEDIEFGIVGGIYVNELTWDDVGVVLRGLERFYAEKANFVGLTIYIEDERRVAVGDASISLKDRRKAAGPTAGSSKDTSL